MRILLWIIRIYTFLIIMRALTSWFGDIPGPIGAILHMVTYPVWYLFGWAQLGSINFGGVIALLILFGLEDWVKKQLGDTKHEPQRVVEGDEPD